MRTPLFPRNPTPCSGRPPAWFLLFLSALPLRAEPSPFRLDWRVDAPLTALSGGLTLAGALLEGRVDAHWDGVVRSETEVPAWDRWAVRPFRSDLDGAGKVLTGVALASPAALLATEPGEWAVIGVMYAQSALLTGGMKNTLKGLFPRDRPYLYHDAPPEEGIESGDFRRAFPSGHTAYAFNGAVFTSCVYAAYFPDSPWKTPVTVLALGTAAAVGVMRVAGGSHFVSDVLAGAALGALTGYGVPRLHRRGEDSGISVLPTPSGLGITLRW